MIDPTHSHLAIEPWGMSGPFGKPATPHPVPNMSSTPVVAAHGWPSVLHGDALRDIVAERIAQVEQHGFTLEHDLGHLPEHLALAGASYVNTAIDELHGKRSAADEVPDTWPFDDGWNPSDTRHNLVKGIAILWAAVDRLDATHRDAGDIHSMSQAEAEARGLV